MAAAHSDTPAPRSGRPPRPVLVIGAVIGAVLLVGILLVVVAVVPACGCRPNPSAYATGVITAIDAPAARFTLKSPSGPMLVFQLPPDSDPRRQEVEAAYATHAAISVSYLRSQTRQPFTSNSIQRLESPVATP